ncbi:glycoside hydrolase family 61 protein [Tricladium varicosporioides]|nr:glycoside hydrolase family 61 protein [Hymenoscyphus varicosporioides]
MKFTALLAVASTATAHTIFTQLQSGGTTYPISYGIRTPTYDGPITDVSTNDVACNGGPNPTTPSSNIINVRAGDTVVATWRHTLTSTAANDAVYVVDPSHKGPTLAYMKKVTDATTDTGIGGGWFKIQHAGLDPTQQTWAVSDLIAAGGLQQIKIPSCLANGQYLLRAELIALHGAGSPNGAQLYMECAQINVTGGTGTAAPSTVSFPGAYKSTDPGLLVNIYQTLSSYTIPGPAPFTCDAGSTPVTSVGGVVTTAAPTTLVTSTKVSTSAKASSTSSAGTVALYGQCGGSSYNGPTTCASGTCKVSNEFYSQCLP